MRLFADESVDYPIVATLRERGHDVEYVGELSPGIADTEVLRIAVEERRLLITADKDFGDLVFRQNLPTVGIVLIRLAGISPTDKATLVANVIRDRSPDMPGAFTVITPKLVRIRHSTE